MPPARRPQQRGAAHVPGSPAVAPQARRSACYGERARHMSHPMSAHPLSRLCVFRIQTLRTLARVIGQARQTRALRSDQCVTRGGSESDAMCMITGRFPRGLQRFLAIYGMHVLLICPEVGPECLAVCRTSQVGSMSTRRHGRGARCGRRSALPQRGDTPRLLQNGRVTQWEKLSDQGLPVGVSRTWGT